MLTIENLVAVCPLTKRFVLSNYINALNMHMPEFDINTLLRIRHFIAQVAHESAAFNFVKELASGQAYEGRKDIGNINTGDGIKYKGRGLIQITGRNNYERCSIALFGDKRLILNPEILEQPDNAVKSACWYWKANGLNALADTDDIKAITKRINGGYNGLNSRIIFYQRAQKSIV